MNRFQKSLSVLCLSCAMLGICACGANNSVSSADPVVKDTVAAKTEEQSDFDQVWVMTEQGAMEGYVQKDYADELAEAFTGSVNTDALKLREDSDGDADVLTLLMEKQKVDILGEQDGFYRIAVQTEDGTLEGYVKKEYIDMD